MAGDPLGLSKAEQIMPHDGMSFCCGGNYTLARAGEDDNGVWHTHLNGTRFGMVGTLLPGSSAMDSSRPAWGMVSCALLTLAVRLVYLLANTPHLSSPQRGLWSIAKGCGGIQSDWVLMGLLQVPSPPQCN